MNPPSSSTSSSDTERRERRRALTALGWAVLWLIVLDILAGVLFRYPSDPKDLNPGPLALYFDYGRSMEGRLRRATREDPDASAPITLAGWYDPLVDTERPAPAGAPRVTIYGMSHAMRLADALHMEAPELLVRSVGAPGATANWSFGAFRRDPERKQSDVAVLAIMSSTLPMILSPAPMDWNTSFAMPYTADRYVLREGQLRVITPPYESFASYVRTVEDPEAWGRALDQFARTDPFYDPLLVRETWLDNSTLVRLLRRGWSQRRDQQRRGQVLTANSYEPDSEALQVANAIISAFARQARAEGIVPVIYVVDNLGYGDQLSRALRATLDKERIPYLSSSRVIDPGNPAGYLADSHFTDANDRLLGRELAKIIQRELPPAGTEAD